MSSTIYEIQIDDRQEEYYPTRKAENLIIKEEVILRAFEILFRKYDIDPEFMETDRYDLNECWYIIFEIYESDVESFRKLLDEHHIYAIALSYREDE